MEVATKSSQHRVPVVVAAVAHVGVRIQNPPLHGDLQETAMCQKPSDTAERGFERPDGHRFNVLLVVYAVAGAAVGVRDVDGDGGRGRGDQRCRDDDQKSGERARGAEWLPWISSGCYYRASEGRRRGRGRRRRFLHRVGRHVQSNVPAAEEQVPEKEFDQAGRAAFGRQRDLRSASEVFLDALRLRAADDLCSVRQSRGRRRPFQPTHFRDSVAGTVEDRPVRVHVPSCAFVSIR